MAFRLNPSKTNPACEKLRAHIEFDKYAVALEDLSLSDITALLQIPECDTPCTVRRARNRSGSVYEQLRQNGLVAGFMRSSDGNLKVLVLYTDQPDADDPVGYRWEFVDIDRVDHRPAFKDSTGIKAAAKIKKSSKKTSKQ